MSPSSSTDNDDAAFHPGLFHSFKTPTAPLLAVSARTLHPPRLSSCTSIVAASMDHATASPSFDQLPSQPSASVAFKCNAKARRDSTSDPWPSSQRTFEESEEPANMFPVFSSPTAPGHVGSTVFSSDQHSPSSARFSADLPRSVSATPDIDNSPSLKGKARELVPPALPPLDFTPAAFPYGSPDWSTGAGPSSYGSLFSSPSPSSQISTSPFPMTLVSPPSSPSPSNRPESRARAPSRTRSLSNLSTRSRRSFSVLSLNKAKFKFNTQRHPSNLTKKLFSKRESGSSTPISSEPDVSLSDYPLVDLSLADLDVVGQSTCWVPWSRDMKSQTPLATPVVGTEVAWGSIHPVQRSPLPTDSFRLQFKTRSYSFPLPLPSSPLDIVPLSPANIFAPVSVVPPNYFDELLPHELKIHILAILVRLHQEDHEKLTSTAGWTALRAGSSKHRWVGRDKGIRELFKLRRVSRAWQALVFDGQLWADMDLRAFPKLPSHAIDRLAHTAGTFVASVNLCGHTNLHSSTLHNFADSISTWLSDGSHINGELFPSHTQLTRINLRGCTLLTTHSLHTLLVRSPLLQELCVKGLAAVTNTTCEALASYCPRLAYLDMSRCPNMNAEGIHFLATHSLASGELLRLRVLKVAGLKRITDNAMAALGKATPLLEVLDISGARDLHNSSVDAFVSCADEDAIHCETVHLTSREAGRDPTDPSRIRRRVTRLKHLSLSSCSLLTDHACSHLAFAVPNLQFLELAGIGSELRDDGVVRLLSTAPFIRRIDLEDANEITDDVLAALTPTRDDPPEPSHRIIPEPGHALEEIILSNTNVTNDALLALVRTCTRLRLLEADNTRLAGSGLREFVELSRQRNLCDSRIVAIDCRHVSESAVKELAPVTRPRLGWRSWHARKLGYLDAQDAEGLGVGQDECDKKRVVVKTFYSWQTVDTVRVAREKKRKSESKRGGNTLGSHDSQDGAVASSSRVRWWSSSGRRSSGRNTPNPLDLRGGDREGCAIM